MRKDSNLLHNYRAHYRDYMLYCIMNNEYIKNNNYNRINWLRQEYIKWFDEHAKDLKDNDNKKFIEEEMTYLNEKFEIENYNIDEFQRESLESAKKELVKKELVDFSRSEDE